VDFDVLAEADDIEAVEPADRAFRLALGGTKGGEVVPPDETLCRRMHGDGVEAAGDVPEIMAGECRRRPPIENAVEIMARNRRETRLEIRADFLR